jgi:hypothetical protein
MSSLIVQGLPVDEVRLAWLREWTVAHGHWSRKRLARELCVAWDWRNDCGRLKDFAARSFLLKLEAGGWLTLPRLRDEKRRLRPPVSELPDWVEPPRWEGPFQALAPVRLAVIHPGGAEAGRRAYLLEHYHYLGFRVVGENPGCLAYDCGGREVACLLFGAPAWRCQARDAYLQGTHAEPRTANLRRIANNTRFLVLPWVRVPHLASHLLGRVAARISGDWQAKYGHGLDWLETFVDTERYAGICYRAANWRRVGETTGRSRQDREHRCQVSRKAVYLYRLRR